MMGLLVGCSPALSAEFAGIQNDECFDRGAAVPALWLKAGTLFMWSDLAFPVQFNYNQ